MIIMIRAEIRHGVGGGGGGLVIICRTLTSLAPLASNSVSTISTSTNNNVTNNNVDFETPLKVKNPLLQVGGMDHYFTMAFEADPNPLGHHR
jgi:hypothetical protein